MRLPDALREAIESLTQPDPAALAHARRHLDSLTKPLGSLGMLEDLAARLEPLAAHMSLPLRKAVYVFAADHGIAAEGVSAYPQEVTAQMIHNFLQGGAAINVLALQHDVGLLVVDVGVNADFTAQRGLHSAKIARGSRNFAKEPALSEADLYQALDLGLELAHSAASQKQQMIAVGEMGIGNTSSASAITALLTGLPLAEVTGRGAGLDDAAQDHKRRILQRALDRHFPVGANPPHPLEILLAVGGLEIAAMTGFILELASLRRIIVCDGFISTTAAALACALAPPVKQFLFAGHCSAEPGHRHLLAWIGLSPVLQLNMRLGEGTGAVLAMPLLESALHLYREMATFRTAGVSEARS